MEDAKQRIIDGLDKDADETTKDVANNLTDSEAEKLDFEFQSVIKMIGKEPRLITILKLRRGGTGISYRLNCVTQIWGGARLD